MRLQLPDTCSLKSTYFLMILFIKNILPNDILIYHSLSAAPTSF